MIKKRKSINRDLEDEILKFAEYYRNVDKKIVKDCYEQYISLIIEESNLNRIIKNDLYNCWYDLIK